MYDVFPQSQNSGNGQNKYISYTICIR